MKGGSGAAARAWRAAGTAQHAPQTPRSRLARPPANPPSPAHQAGPLDEPVGRAVAMLHRAQSAVAQAVPLRGAGARGAQRARQQPSETGRAGRAGRLRRSCAAHRRLRERATPAAATARRPPRAHLDAGPVLLPQRLRPRARDDDLAVQEGVLGRHDLLEGAAAGEVQVGAPAGRARAVGGWAQRQRQQGGQPGWCVSGASTGRPGTCPCGR